MALLGLQHFVLIAPSLAIVVLIARSAGAETEAIATMISFALIALAITTVLQGFECIGSGFFIVSCNTAIYVSASLVAAAGGLPLVFGMTLIAGLIQIVFAEVLKRMRRYFPPEIVALTIIIVGVELGVVGLQRMWTAGGPGLLIGTLTLFLSVVLGVYGRGPLRLYCALIGMVSGYGLSAYAGLVNNELLGHALGREIFAVPDLPVPRLDFDWGLILPFAFAAIAASLKTMGAVVTCDKICDAGWVRPDMRLVRRGIIIDGLATALSGLAGAVGTNSSIANIGVSHATGATSRVIGFAVAGWMLLFALTPKFTYLFVAMPAPVVGGGLVF
ncbi:MAG: solute carrier family 23 protein, partial [Propionivibrio sp.]